MNLRASLSLILCLTMLAPAGVAQAPAGGMTIEDLRVIVGKSLVIDYPADINRISTSNPDVVDAVPATSREFLLHGKGHGAATVVVWAKNGMRTMYNVTVEHNLDPIRSLLKAAFPNENVQVQAGKDSVALSGVVSSKEVAERMVAATTPLAKAVVSNMTLASPAVGKQIVLRVRFAELNRTAAQQFGVNLVSTGAANTFGVASTQQFSSVRPSTLTGGIPGGLQGSSANFGVTDALNIFAFRPDLNLAGFIKALQNQGLLQILAEPNLVTTNGREASFLAGGEFPVPVLQGGGNAGAVTIQFREFGIRLNFLPQITDNSTIKLYVKPEVSTLDLANAVTISGFTIPALSTKRIETNIELGAGQSFVIAGLMDDRVNETMNKIPGLANIPILGALFRSRSINKAKQELVVIVTPELASPLNPGDKKPDPVWLEEFLPKLKPGDPTGMEILPGKPDKVPTDATASAPAPSAPKADAGVPAEEKSGKKFLFWGNKGKNQTAAAAAAAPKGTPVTPAAPAPTPAEPTLKPGDTPGREAALTVPVPPQPVVQTPVEPVPAPAPAVETSAPAAVTPVAETPVAAAPVASSTPVEVKPANSESTAPPVETKPEVKPEAKPEVAPEPAAAEAKPPAAPTPESPVAEAPASPVPTPAAPTTTPGPPTPTATPTPVTPVPVTPAAAPVTTPAVPPAPTPTKGPATRPAGITSLPASLWAFRASESTASASAEMTRAALLNRADQKVAGDQ